MLNIDWTLIRKKFVAGIETYLLGLVMTFGPQILDYTAHFDWTKLGLSPNAASMVGLAILGLRSLDSIGEVPHPNDLTGSEISGNNAANR